MSNGSIRRHRQAGSIYYYVIQVLDPQTGRKKPKWVRGAPTRAATVAMRDKARASMHDGTWVTPQNLTVSDWLDRWMTAHEVELKPSTSSSYRAKIELYLKPSIGHERVQSLSPSRLSVVWRDLQSSGGKGGKALSRRTVEFASGLPQGHGRRRRGETHPGQPRGGLQDGQARRQTQARHVDGPAGAPLPPGRRRGPLDAAVEPVRRDWSTSRRGGRTGGRTTSVPWSTSTPQRCASSEPPQS